MQVDVDTKNRQFSFAENATFVLAVVCIFGYFGNFLPSKGREEEKKRKLKRIEREESIERVEDDEWE